MKQPHSVSESNLGNLKIILMDFHHHESPLSLNALDDSLNVGNLSLIYRLFELLKRKFENQGKGFSKWLQAREKWLKDLGIDDSYCDISIEFMNDRECATKFLNHYDDFHFPVRWMVQHINLSELCEKNHEWIEHVEFWRPFKTGIMNLLKNKKLQVLQHIPKEMLFEWIDDLSSIFNKYFRFSFIRYIDEAKKALSEGCCLSQLSAMLRDHEEIVKHAVNTNSYNMLHASGRLKHDRKFCMDTVRSNPLAFLTIPEEFKNDKEFVLELLDTPITILDGKIEQDLIQTYTPEVYILAPESMRDEIPIEIKMKVYQQLFLKDVTIDYIHIQDAIMKQAFRTLHELSDDQYFEAHKNCQRHPSHQGWFIDTTFRLFRYRHTLQQDEEFASIVEQAMTRFYKNFDQLWMEDEEVFLRRKDLAIILEYGPLALRKNRNFVFQVVKRDACNLYYVLPEFRNDRQIVLEAVRNRGYLLYQLLDPSHFVVTAELRDDKEVVLAALHSPNPCLFDDIPQYLQDDSDCLLAIRVHALHNASQHLKQDANFILKTVKQNPRYLENIFSYNHVILNSEIISEYMKRCGIITDDVIDHLSEKCFNGLDVRNVSFDEGVKLFQNFLNRRMEFAYFGCYIPESYLLKEPIKLIEVDDEIDYAFDWWKEHLFRVIQEYAHTS
ncbi:hypothetical protein C9374_003568 [Naegleria lovaniensis]|uniref:DUF4116 domain-containing protein n=1 Tax=Naegleria lovaniensis TaxID=51637 RepID=A0AA88KSL7_NAELO|nr:uncharacterized protein C9374_003568 [Naegleria lovaniensis]KAG2393804.1 hypothetical protein C9374_003568 [Naegleria lovaniensis]